jgi:hypothetical protein
MCLTAGLPGCLCSIVSVNTELPGSLGKTGSIMGYAVHVSCIPLVVSHKTQASAWEGEQWGDCSQMWMARPVLQNVCMSGSMCCKEKQGSGVPCPRCPYWLVAP